ncbi:MAG: hypothetical protein IT454_04265 [Planctomycetes bacterium]|nr:hypothetical protein [Planctomycetota bacterium]
MNRRSPQSLSLPFLPFVLATTATAVAAPQSTTRISVDSAGAQATGGVSAGAHLTPDARYVVFTSQASNLVAGDTNAQPDVFVRDRLSNTTSRISVDVGGNQALGGPSGGCTISSDGRYVAFTSGASNLIVGDTNNSTDTFVKDRQTGAVVRANLSSSGTQGVQFCENARISGNGRFVVFASFDTLFVAGDTNGVEDLFLRDLQTNTTTRVNVDSSGAQANASANVSGISDDGRFVVFTSGASNLVPNDTNASFDVFVRDTVSGQTTRVSLDALGAQIPGHSTDPAISGDGAFTSFSTSVNNVVAGDTNGFLDVFVRKSSDGSVSIASTSSSGVLGNAGSSLGKLSFDGRYVSFSSIASNLVGGDTNFNFDAFLKDRVTGVTTLISQSSAGVIGNFGSFPDALSADGRYVAFQSECTNLVAGDTNNQYDVFLRDRGQEQPVAYCSAKTNSQGCVPAIGFSGSPSVTSAVPFNVTAVQVLNNKNGLLFYGFWWNNLPFQGGTLCVKAPTLRTALQNSAGNAPPDDCSGVFAFDFNARIQTGIDPRLQLGRTVFAQYWYRDPADVTTTGLTDGLRFVIGP